jgi:DNA mismatch repair ATPase MutS
MPSPEFYKHRAQQFQFEQAQIEKIIKRYAWARVLLALLTGALIYLGFSEALFFWLTPIPLFIFIFLVNRQSKQEVKKQLVSYLALLNQKEAKAILFESADFSNGHNFSDPHHTYSHDLDLFGDGSVFQFINRCGTQVGEERLAHDLRNLPFAEAELRLRQDAVKELGTMLEFRQQIWALGRQINDFSFDRATLLRWLKEKPFIYRNTRYSLLRWGLPAITLIILGFTIYDQRYFPLMLIMMIGQITIAGFHSKRIGEFQQVLSSGRKVLSNYARIFEQLAKLNVESELMMKHHVHAMSAFDKVNKFSSLVNALEARMNPIAMQFGNGLFLYDFHAVCRLEKWREENANDLPLWLESLGEWDSLLSLATLHYNFPEYAFADVNQQSMLEGAEVGHLLIPDSIRITNQFSVGKPANIWLITGANMAGKSTFLRALGVNFVLGSVGSPVCASYWRMPLIALRSGMRTTDSLQDHQSYFFAELHRLQSIMQELHSGKPAFILLDEILKGTNSTDKQLGSRELLRQLKDMNALVVLATHDIALGNLAEQYPNQIANACFEGKIENDQLTFDYTLHPGVAKKANATFLMRKMGIIPPEAH